MLTITFNNNQVHEWNLRQEGKRTQLSNKLEEIIFVEQVCMMSH